MIDLADLRVHLLAERIAIEARSRYRVRLHGMTFEQRAAFEGRHVRELRNADEAARLVEQPLARVVRNQSVRSRVE